MHTHAHRSPRSTTCCLKACAGKTRRRWCGFGRTGLRSRAHAWTPKTKSAHVCGAVWSVWSGAIALFLPANIPFSGIFPTQKFRPACAVRLVKTLSEIASDAMIGMVTGCSLSSLCILPLRHNHRLLSPHLPLLLLPVPAHTALLLSILQPRIHAPWLGDLADLRVASAETEELEVCKLR